jgi:hypothetical protein
MAATQTTAQLLTAEEIFRKCQISEGTLIESFCLRLYKEEHREGRGRPVPSLLTSFPRGSQARLRADRRPSVCSTIGVSLDCGEQRACPNYDALQHADLRGRWRATWATRLEGREPPCG